MPTQTKKHAGQIAGFHAGVDQAAVKGGKLTAVMTEGLGQRNSAIEFVGHLPDSQGEAAPIQISGDQPQAALHRKPGFGELSQLLVEREEIAAREPRPRVVAGVVGSSRTTRR